jgi:hypothetical protein
MLGEIVLLGAMSGDTRHILVSDTSAFSVGDFIKIEDELMRIRDIIGRVLIVDRGIEAQAEDQP